jgi:helix-turn-helix protein
MTTHAITPHTRIDNSIIDDLAAKIGIYGLGIYIAIKRHLNQKTGDCFPSYKTIARKLGIDRSTVIRYVKKLKEFNLIDPEWRFKEDGSHNSNQYNFQEVESSAPSGGGTKPLPVVVEDNHPGSPQPPKQSEPNKKQRTITDVDFMPTEKQRNCPHPASEVVRLTAGIVVCHHCYSLLSEELTHKEEEMPPSEIVAA